jgi:hypothetical protein
LWWRAYSAAEGHRGAAGEADIRNAGESHDLLLLLLLLSLLFISFGGSGRRGVICTVCGMKTTVDHTVDVIVFDQSNEKLL